MKKISCHLNIKHSVTAMGCSSLLSLSVNLMSFEKLKKNIEYIEIE